jgi:hypothetical protein
MELQDCLHQVNPHVWYFKVALDKIPINNRNNYNKPSTNEVAVLVDQHHERRDIVLFTRNGSLK